MKGRTVITESAITTARSRADARITIINSSSVSASRTRAMRSAASSSIKTPGRISAAER